MKLRLFANRVRLRLSRHEVARVARGEEIVEQTPLAPQPFVCQLVPIDGSFSTRFVDGTLLIRAPRSALRTWAEGNDVGLSNVDADGVHLLIEKDFQCLHGDDENQPDCFPHPLADVTR